MKSTPFRIFTFAIFIILIIPNLIQDGMFMDGVLYAAVAKNQAEGLGSFWFPIFAETWNKHGASTFHEHPPLVFGIQAVFFKIFGASLYVERFYTFIMAILSAWLIHLNWKVISKKDTSFLSEFSWLPILMWIIIPVCFWSFQNNMQENTMTVFTLAATYFSFKFYFEKSSNSTLFLSGVFIFLASFCKGVPGLFPLAIPFLYWLSFKEISFVNVLQHTSTLAFSAFGIYVLLMMYEPANESLIFYFENRLMGRIESDPTVSSRFYIVGRLFQELLPSLILAGIIFIFLKIKNRSTSFDVDHIRKTGFLFLIGLAGTLPLMLTMVQKGFYMVHALPYFGLAIAMLLAPNFGLFYNNTNTASPSLRNFQYFSILFLIISLGFSFSKMGKTKRDQEMLSDVYSLKNILPPKAHISLEKSLHLDWNLKVYLMRKSEITTHNKLVTDYFLSEKKKKDFDLNGFKKVPSELKKYVLWKRN